MRKKREQVIMEDYITNFDTIVEGDDLDDMLLKLAAWMSEKAFYKAEHNLSLKCSNTKIRPHDVIVLSAKNHPKKQNWLWNKYIEYENVISAKRSFQKTGEFSMDFHQFDGFERKHNHKNGACLTRLYGDATGVKVDIRASTGIYNLRWDLNLIHRVLAEIRVPEDLPVELMISKLKPKWMNFLITVLEHGLAEKFKHTPLMQREMRAWKRFFLRGEACSYGAVRNLTKRVTKQFILQGWEPEKQVDEMMEHYG